MQAPQAQHYEPQVVGAYRTEALAGSQMYGQYQGPPGNQVWYHVTLKMLLHSCPIPFASLKLCIASQGQTGSMRMNEMQAPQAQHYEPQGVGAYRMETLAGSQIRGQFQCPPGNQVWYHVTFKMPLYSCPIPFASLKLCIASQGPTSSMRMNVMQAPQAQLYGPQGVGVHRPVLVIMPPDHSEKKVCYVLTLSDCIYLASSGSDFTLPLQPCSLIIQLAEEQEAHPRTRAHHMARVVMEDQQPSTISRAGSRPRTRAHHMATSGNG